jgi:hypothetical protein
MKKVKHGKHVDLNHLLGLIVVIIEESTSKESKSIPIDSYLKCGFLEN